MNRIRSSRRPARTRLDNIFVRKKEHAIRRCSQRCQRRYKDYKRMVRHRQAEPMLKETNTVRWYAFEEPSGERVFGLWNHTRQIFYTFLTEEMFKNRMRYENGDLDAYGPGRHRREAMAVA